jgi:ABC-type branched-subunit amino acid transport system substrate-binding protein
MWSSQRRHRYTAGTALAAVLLVAACSSSGSNSAGGDNSTGGSSSGAGGATGAPILIGSSGSLHNPAYTEPELKAGLDAAVASVNAAGGIKGHPLKLDFCDSQYDPNKELSCARHLISDKVVAAVHPSIFADSSGAEFKLYKQAGISIFGGYGVSPFELTDSNSYPLSSGLVGWVYGAAKALKDAGATKISVVGDTNPPSQFFVSLAAGALKTMGYANVNKITGDDKADPTYATAAAKATGGGTDGILIGTGPVDFPVAVKAIKATGYQGKIGVIAPTLEPPILKALGSKTEDFLVSSQMAFVTDTSNPAIVKFTADMQKYQPSAIVDDLSLAAWAAVQLFVKVAETSTAATLDSAAFDQALANLSTPVDIGVIAPWSVKGVTSPVADFPRVLNPTVQVGVVHGGKIVPDGKGYLNPFSSS